MRLVHTADVHLREYNDERWKALETIIALANREECDVITVSGDLFDNAARAEQLRGKIRELFSQTRAKILIIPGNHDAHVFRSGYFFGENVHVFTDISEPFIAERCYFWGFPFSEYSEQEILRKLFCLKSRIEEIQAEDSFHFLLIHAELLDGAFLPLDYGDEGTSRYMPVRLAYFEELNLHSVLAGHFHANCSIRNVYGKFFFIYPGSPVSITRKETGRRKVVFIDTEKQSLEEVPIETVHYEEVNISLDPFSQSSPVDVVRNSLKSLDKNARLILKVSGYIDSQRSGITEKALREEIERIVKEYQITLADEICIEYRDIKTILDDDVFRNFNERLASTDISPDIRTHLRELVIKAMMEIL